MWTTNFDFDWSSIFSKNHFITRRFVSSLLLFFYVKKLVNVILWLCVREQVFNVRPDNQNYYRKKDTGKDNDDENMCTIDFFFVFWTWFGSHFVYGNLFQSDSIYNNKKKIKKNFRNSIRLVDWYMLVRWGFVSFLSQYYIRDGRPD